MKQKTASPKKRRAPTFRQMENDPADALMKTHCNLHRVRFPTKTDPNKNPALLMFRPNQQKKICIQSYDDINQLTKFSAKVNRIPSRQLTLGSTNSFMMGTDFKLYNFLDKNINQELLLQAKGVSLNQQTPPTIIKATTCNCKKSKCLKLYCECFSVNEVCTDKCQCVGCNNTEKHHRERQLAKSQQKGRSNSLNEEEDSAVIYRKGCNCRKSGCQKKYCECYQMGMKCTEQCKCRDCKNIELRIKQEQPLQILKNENDHHSHNLSIFDRGGNSLFGRLLQEQSKN